MPEKSESQPSPTSLRGIAQAFRLTGWIGFWIQLVLAVVSGVVVLLFIIFSRNPSSANASNPGTGLGIFLAIGGIVALGVSIYCAFRYVRIGQKLESPNPTNRPRKVESIQVLRLGLMVNLIGMLLTLLGAQATVGTLVAKSISQVQAAVVTDPSRFISSLDMLVVQANTNTIAGHFAGIVCSLWLLNRINRQ